MATDPISISTSTSALGPEACCIWVASPLSHNSKAPQRLRKLQSRTVANHPSTRTQHSIAMAALDMSLVARSEFAVHQLMKRKNWAQREPGVIVVFVIVFLVAILVIAMFINKKVRRFTPGRGTPATLTHRPEKRETSRHQIRYPRERIESDMLRYMWLDATLRMRSWPGRVRTCV